MHPHDARTAPRGLTSAPAVDLAFWLIVATEQARTLSLRALRLRLQAQLLTLEVERLRGPGQGTR